jgi:hypothetical protein
MEISKRDTCKEYTLYAEHCLKMVKIATDQELRIIQRQMAAEWLQNGCSWQMLFPANHQNAGRRDAGAYNENHHSIREER